ncbi:hypothetical protein MZD04_gp305 [Pseudomonas phage Psa21]|uniref:Uncharacterized protein n=1 Tax=Pseudomonas phage Psa21 TaxID=2530023 RepID=A0A481W4U9_9CAUD|nr:hypothetical protein MZD04_gp305 [Pseudomonas phage Psa21]QBJ02831.1 hypothetical protein PSA21_305 [Pseudomonas phage Psa21]
MSCCNDCKKDEGERVEFDVGINFNTNNSYHPDLIGKKINFVSGFLVTAEGAMPKGGFQIQFHSYGARKHINIYRNRLPFDELMATIQFNETTGHFVVQQLTRIEFEKVQLIFTKEHVEEVQYQELALGVYRVPNLDAGIQLSGHLDIDDYTLTQLQIGLRRINSWPALVLHHSQELCVLFTPEHPTWKNDALWQ